MTAMTVDDVASLYDFDDEAFRIDDPLVASHQVNDDPYVAV